MLLELDKRTVKVDGVVYLLSEELFWGEYSVYCPAFSYILRLSGNRWGYEGFLPHVTVRFSREKGEGEVYWRVDRTKKIKLNSVRGTILYAEVVCLQTLYNQRGLFLSEGIIERASFPSIKKTTRIGVCL